MPDLWRQELARVAGLRRVPVAAALGVVIGAVALLVTAGHRGYWYEDARAGLRVAAFVAAAVTGILGAVLGGVGRGARVDRVFAETQLGRAGFARAAFWGELLPCLALTAGGALLGGWAWRFGAAPGWWIGAPIVGWVVARAGSRLVALPGFSALLGAGAVVALLVLGRG